MGQEKDLCTPVIGPRDLTSEGWHDHDQVLHFAFIRYLPFPLFLHRDDTLSSEKAVLYVLAGAARHSFPDSSISPHHLCNI